MIGGKKIIAVDFDGTLSKGRWPGVGVPNLLLIDRLIELQKEGNKIILWTCREDEALSNAVEWCKKFNLVFDAINDNLPEIKQMYGNNSRKIWCDIYIDDKGEIPVWKSEENTENIEIIKEENQMLGFYEDWKMNEGNERLCKWVEDPTNLLSSERGHVQGVYAIDIVVSDTNDIIPFYVGEIGIVRNMKDNAAKNVQERILQHLKAWLGGDYVTYWTGIDVSDLESGKYKFRVTLLEKERSYARRKQLEEDYIIKRKPLLQYSPYPKYPTKDYNRIDLCIYPWHGQRRKAFVDKVSELYKEKHQVIDYLLSKIISKEEWEKISEWRVSEQTRQKVFEEMPQYSDLHEKLKRKVDSELEIPMDKRGCTYGYLVNLVSKATTMLEYTVD